MNFRNYGLALLRSDTHPLSIETRNDLQESLDAMADGDFQALEERGNEPAFMPGELGALYDDGGHCAGSAGGKRVSDYPSLPQSGNRYL